MKANVKNQLFGHGFSIPDAPDEPANKEHSKGK